MVVVVTYDLDRGWNELKAAAFEGDFYNIIQTTKGQKQAPASTLFINDVTVAAAVAAFDAAIVAATAKLGQKITVDKVFAAAADGWIIRSNEPKS